MRRLQLLGVAAASVLAVGMLSSPAYATGANCPGHNNCNDNSSGDSTSTATSAAEAAAEASSASTSTSGAMATGGDASATGGTGIGIGGAGGQGGSATIGDVTAGGGSVGDVSAASNQQQGQGQDQHQQQGQGQDQQQGQGQRQQARTGDNNVSVNQEAQKRDPVASAFAAGATGWDCGKVDGAGAQTIPFGISLSISGSYEDCRELEVHDRMVARGMHVAANSLLCDHDGGKYRKHLAAQGIDCSNLAVSPAAQVPVTKTVIDKSGQPKAVSSSMTTQPEPQTVGVVDPSAPAFCNDPGGKLATIETIFAKCAPDSPAIVAYKQERGML